jgi:hypothetical protein
MVTFGANPERTRRIMSSLEEMVAADQMDPTVNEQEEARTRARDAYSHYSADKERSAAIWRTLQT